MTKEGMLFLKCEFLLTLLQDFFCLKYLSYVMINFFNILTLSGCYMELNNVLRSRGNEVESFSIRINRVLSRFQMAVFLIFEAFGRAFTSCLGFKRKPVVKVINKCEPTKTTVTIVSSKVEKLVRAAKPLVDDVKETFKKNSGPTLTLDQRATEVDRAVLPVFAGAAAFFGAVVYLLYRYSNGTAGEASPIFTPIIEAAADGLGRCVEKSFVNASSAVVSQIPSFATVLISETGMAAKALVSTSNDFNPLIFWPEVTVAVAATFALVQSTFSRSIQAMDSQWDIQKDPNERLVTQTASIPNISNMKVISKEYKERKDNDITSNLVQMVNMPVNTRIPLPPAIEGFIKIKNSNEAAEAKAQARKKINEFRDRKEINRNFRAEIEEWKKEIEDYEKNVYSQVGSPAQQKKGILLELVLFYEPFLNEHEEQPNKLNAFKNLIEKIKISENVKAVSEEFPQLIHNLQLLNKEVPSEPIGMARKGAEFIAQRDSIERLQEKINLNFMNLCENPAANVDHSFLQIKNNSVRSQYITLIKKDLGEMMLAIKRMQIKLQDDVDLRSEFDRLFSESKPVLNAEATFEERILAFKEAPQSNSTSDDDSEWD